jgi:anti-sigma regulatory factor (Ser/Thr protein kinase)
VSDCITLTIPRERPFHSVAHLVLGGLALRRNLTIEHLEDLQVALDELLDDEGGDVTVELRVEPGAVQTSIGPFDERLRAELERERGDGSPALSRVLGTVVDEFEVVDRDGRAWIELRKSVEEPEPAAGAH